MADRQTVSAAAGPRRRKWFRFGPGLALAAMAGIGVWLLQAPQGPTRPLVGRSDLPAPSTPGLTAPDPTWLLARKAALGLTVTQEKRLGQAKARWDRDTRELRANLDQAAAGLSQTLSTPGGQAVSLLQVRKQGASVSQLTRDLLEARRAWWSEAGKALTARQRREAEQAWARRFMPGGEHR